MLKRLVATIAALLALFPIGALAADATLSLEANTAYLAQSARQKGVIVRPSGLQYRILQNGSGKHPGPTDHVTVYYTGSLINGKVFDGTEPGFPVVFMTNALIKGWSEALQLMREGDHWQLVIPAELGYGSRGAGEGEIPPNQTLVFDLQLLGVSGPTKEEQAHEAEQQQEEQDHHPGPGAE
jgi:FKBP-type peptidyl-prolyl cis-trans isomerase